MEVINHLMLGFGVAMTPINLMYGFIGVLLGTLIGVLPGIGPVAAIAMLLPATYSLPPVASLIMLSGIYYGCQYGGSTTAILINVPGESSAVVTTLDGHAMAKNGKAGAALGISAIGSFFAGCVVTLLIAAAAIPLSRIAFKFGPSEFFALMILGLMSAAAMASKSMLKAIAMIVVGLLLGLIGTDVNSGFARFSFGIPELMDGIGIVAVAMGLFGLTEIITNVSDRNLNRTPITGDVGDLLPTKSDLKQAAPAIFRGTLIGSILGLLPGGGAMLSSFVSYSIEKSMKLKEGEVPLGTGNIRGVAGPESANNAGAQASFIPLLSLGLPENAVMALMIGAMMIHGITPGPSVITNNPDIFWGLIASMWIGNLMLVVLNLPLIGLWIRALKIPYRWLFPSIVVFCAIGVYSTNNSVFDIWMVSLFGLIGYTFSKLGMEVAPLILGFILGPMMEENLRRAMLISRGDWSILYDRPIAGTLLAIAGGILIWSIVSAIRGKKRQVFKDHQ